MRTEEVAFTREEHAVLREVLKAIREIRFGYVQIVLQDARVVQIEKVEKVRLTPPGRCT